MRDIYLDVQEGARVIQGRFDCDYGIYHIEYDRFSKVLLQCYITENLEKRNKIENRLIQYFESEKGKKEVKDELLDMLKETRREEKKKKIKWLLQQEEEKTPLPTLQISEPKLSTKAFDTDASFAIFFMIEERLYSLYIENIGEKMVPMHITHMNEKSQKFCPYCNEMQQGEHDDCFVLSYYTKEIFHQLLLHPSIRLKMRFSSRYMERMN